MFFNSRMSRDLPNIVFAGQEIEWVSEFKYLGLILTNKMSFGLHISKVALNVSRISGLVRSVRHFLPRTVLLKLYESLVLPHMTLHPEIWGSAPACQLRKLEPKINNLLRLIFGIHSINGIPTMGASDMYTNFNILRLKSHFKLKVFW